MSVEEVFAKVLGRTPSEEERARLERLREALGIRDNDALWSVVLALEHYDAFFRKYPGELAAQTGRCIEQARVAFAAAAAREAAQVQRRLSEQVAETSVAIARQLADQPVGIHRITTALAAVVAFGALCVCAGYTLATPERPFWVNRDVSRSPSQRALAAVLGVPAGWMIFALLAPAAGYGAKVGWTMANDVMADRRDRVVGGCLVLACVLGAIASAVLLAKAT